MAEAMIMHNDLTVTKVVDINFSIWNITSINGKDIMIKKMENLGINIMGSS